MTVYQLPFGVLQALARTAARPPSAFAARQLDQAPLLSQTGKAQPSREIIAARLAERLEVPLRDQNTLLGRRLCARL